mgnify:FL=1
MQAYHLARLQTSLHQATGEEDMEVGAAPQATGAKDVEVGAARGKLDLGVARQSSAQVPIVQSGSPACAPSRREYCVCTLNTCVASLPSRPLGLDSDMEVGAPRKKLELQAVTCSMI